MIAKLCYWVDKGIIILWFRSLGIVLSLNLNGFNYSTFPIYLVIIRYSSIEIVITEWLAYIHFVINIGYKMFAKKVTFFKGSIKKR